MKTSKKKILIINGSIRGKKGNSWTISKTAEKYLKSKHIALASILTLTEPKPSIKDVFEILRNHDGFLIVSGNYWNSWGSSLQRFIEVITTFENSPALFGKPVACAVSMDSVGGVEIAARIHAVFSGLGCWSPPCSTLVISRLGQDAVSSTKGQNNDPNEDVWRIDDIEIVLDNLIVATSLQNNLWTSWPYIELKIPNGQWPEYGSLNLDTPKFL